MDYRKFNILLAYRLVSIGPGICSNLCSSEIRLWMDTWDPFIYKYRREKREELFSLLPYKPIKDWESYNWYWNAEYILNPFPEQDLWTVINLLKIFLTNPLEIQKVIMDLPVMSNQDTKVPLIIELDNFPIPQEEHLISVKESFNSIDSEQLIEQKNSKKQTLPMHMVTSLEMVSKKFLKERVNKK